MRSNNSRLIKPNYILVILFISFIAFISFTNTSHPQNNNQQLPSTNYDEFFNAVSKTFTIIEDRLTVLGKNKIYLLKLKAGDEQSAFFLPLFKVRFKDYRMLYSDVNDTLDYIIVIQELKMKTLYPEILPERILGDKIFRRKISVSYRFSVLGKNDSTLYSASVSEKSLSDVPLDYLEYVESGNYEFMRSDLPDESLFGKLLIPGIIIVSSAAAVILFFSVRSK